MVNKMYFISFRFQFTYSLYMYVMYIFWQFCWINGNLNELEIVRIKNNTHICIWHKYTYTNICLCMLYGKTSVYTAEIHYWIWVREIQIFGRFPFHLYMSAYSTPLSHITYASHNAYISLYKWYWCNESAMKCLLGFSKARKISLKIFCMASIAGWLIGYVVVKWIFSSWKVINFFVFLLWCSFL